MTNTIKTLLSQKYFLIIITLTIILRIINLGYSDFQGDEIKALFLPDSGSSNIEFLLDQRKGPIQFVVTYLLKFIDPNYTNQLLIRLPFAIAGILSVVYFYKLLQNLYNPKIAFYACFFFATNGFLVAFSRIVQYQSFVILFMIASLYYLHKKNMYAGLILWAFSILSHYDGVFIFPLAFYFIYQYITDINNINTKDLISILKIRFNKKNIIHFISAGLISLAVLAVFYIPFVLNISDSTQSYWLGRITGNVSSKISSSMYLFTVYQPIYVIHIYLGLFLMGLGYYLFKAQNNIDKKKRIKKILLKVTPKFISNRVVKINFEDKSLITGIILLWIFIPWVFLELFVYIPGTHIYTYIIPATVLMAVALFVTEKIFDIFNVTKYLYIIATLLVFTFIFLQSYAVFVDNNIEYPYEPEPFFVWTLPQPTPIYHLSIFGFPYFRNWEDIGSFIKNYPFETTHYSTNERESISRYYIDLQKDTSNAGFFVHIRNPQSFEDNIRYEKALYWSEKHDPVYIFSKDGRELVNIYYMEVGDLEEIIEKGF